MIAVSLVAYCEARGCSQTAKFLASLETVLAGGAAAPRGWHYLRPKSVGRHKLYCRSDSARLMSEGFEPLVPPEAAREGGAL